MNNIIQQLIKTLPSFNDLIFFKNSSVSENMIQIFVNIINICNYKCKYCYNINNINNIKLNLTKLLQFLIILNNKTKKNIQLLFLGGEPTLHPDLLDFVKKIQNYIFIHLYIHSNLSATTEFYFNLLKYQRVNFIFSWHSSNKNFYIKAKNIKNTINTNKFKKQIFVVMYEHDNINIANLIYKMLIDINATVELCLIDVIVRRNNPYIYNQNQINNALMLNNREEKNIILYYKNNFQISINEFQYACLIYYNYIKDYTNWQCISRMQYIHTNGDIFNCLEQYYLNMQPLFNIYNFKNLQNFNFIFNKMIYCKQCKCQLAEKKKI